MWSTVYSTRKHLCALCLSESKTTSDLNPKVISNGKVRAGKMSLSFLAVEGLKLF